MLVFGFRSAVGSWWKEELQGVVHNSLEAANPNIRASAHVMLLGKFAFSLGEKQLGI